MTKEEAYELATMQELGGNPNGTRQDVVWRAMELFAEQEKKREVNDNEVLIKLLDHWMLVTMKLSEMAKLEMVAPQSLYDLEYTCQKKLTEKWMELNQSKIQP